MDIDLVITDTAGQEEYSLLPMHALQSCDGYLLVYAVNDSNSFEGLKNIYKKLQENIGSTRPIVIVGNKVDLNVSSNFAYLIKATVVNFSQKKSLYKVFKTRILLDTIVCMIVFSSDRYDFSMNFIIFLFL